jgi:prolyl-tRNA synthetase
LVNLINLSPKNQEVTTACDALYDSLMKARIEVLYDDKDGSVGQKLNNADLIGLPFQIIIGQKSLESSIFEVKNRLIGVVTKIDSGRFDLLLDLLNE